MIINRNSIVNKKEVEIGRAVGYTLSGYGAETVYVLGLKNGAEIDWEDFPAFLERAKNGEISDEEASILLKAGSAVVAVLLKDRGDAGARYSLLKGALPREVQMFFTGVMEGFVKGVEAELEEIESLDELKEELGDQLYETLKEMEEEELTKPPSPSEIVALEKLVSGDRLTEEDKRKAFIAAIKMGEPRFTIAYTRIKASQMKKPEGVVNFVVGHDEPQSSRGSGLGL